MKKILLFLSSVFLISCGSFTVEVKDDAVKINDKAVANGACKHYSAGWLGIGAEDVHYQVGEGEEKHLDVGDWVIENGEATEADEACEETEEPAEEPAEEPTEEATPAPAATPATGTTPDSVATVKTAANCTAADSGGTWSPATSSCSCPAGKVVSDTTGKCATPPPTL